MNTLEMRELDVQEMRNVNGGYGSLCLGLLGALIYDVVSHHEEFMEGYRKARAEK